MGGPGRAEASQCGQERNSRDAGASSSNTELCSCRRPCLPLLLLLLLSCQHMPNPPTMHQVGLNSPITCSPNPLRRGHCRVQGQVQPAGSALAWWEEGAPSIKGSKVVQGLPSSYPSSVLVLVFA